MNVAFFLLGNSAASEFYCILVHMIYEDGTECSKTSAHKIQTPGNRPKEWLQQTRGWREKFLGKKRL